MIEWRSEGVRDHLRFGEYIAIVTPTKRHWHLVDVVKLGNRASERAAVLKRREEAKEWAEKELSVLAAAPIAVRKRLRRRAWWHEGA